MLTSLVLSSGYELVKANALKLFIVFLYTPFALGVFIFNSQVDYRIGLIAAIGNVLGGIFASHIAIKKGAKFIRWVLMVIIILFVAQLLFS